ncbi:MAG: hypothetical protein ACE5GO_08260, partial [Anaerolineales bacterium]
SVSSPTQFMDFLYESPSSKRVVGVRDNLGREIEYVYDGPDLVEVLGLGGGEGEEEREEDEEEEGEEAFHGENPYRFLIVGGVKFPVNYENLL